MLFCKVLPRVFANCWRKLYITTMQETTIYINGLQGEKSNKSVEK